jgi:hypothetical protein
MIKYCMFRLPVAKPDFHSEKTVFKYLVSHLRSRTRDPLTVVEADNREG